MSTLDKAVQTQLDNIQKKTGMSLKNYPICEEKRIDQTWRTP